MEFENSSKNSDRMHDVVHFGNELRNEKKEGTTNFIDRLLSERDS